MNKILSYSSIALVAVLATLVACKPKQQYTSPAGYDLSKPVKYNMPDNLHEISGIAFHGTSDSLFAEEDEHGRVYYLKPGDKAAKFTSFKDKGDFEDIALSKDQVIMLESKGKLFTFPIAELSKPEVTDAQKFDDVLPEGEFEGMYADKESGLIYVLCKHCSIDKTSKSSSGSILQLTDSGKIKQEGNFQINVKAIEKQLGTGKISFHPSALTQSPATKDWYILSSVNKILVIAGSDWGIKNVYPLNPDLFPQPEGIAFDSQNNLWISNEGQNMGSGTVLKFPFHK